MNIIKAENPLKLIEFFKTLRADEFTQETYKFFIENKLYLNSFIAFCFFEKNRLKQLLPLIKTEEKNLLESIGFIVDQLEDYSHLDVNVFKTIIVSLVKKDIKLCNKEVFYSIFTSLTSNEISLFKDKGLLSNTFLFNNIDKNKEEIIKYFLMKNNIDDFDLNQHMLFIHYLCSSSEQNRYNYTEKIPKTEPTLFKIVANLEVFKELSLEFLNNLEYDKNIIEHLSKRLQNKGDSLSKKITESSMSKEMKEDILKLTLLSVNPENIFYISDKSISEIFDEKIEIILNKLNKSNKTYSERFSSYIFEIADGLSLEQKTKLLYACDVESTKKEKCFSFVEDIRKNKPEEFYKIFANKFMYLVKNHKQNSSYDKLKEFVSDSVFSKSIDNSKLCNVKLILGHIIYEVYVNNIKQIDTEKINILYNLNEKEQSVNFENFSKIFNNSVVFDKGILKLIFILLGFKITNKSTFEKCFPMGSNKSLSLIDFSLDLYPELFNLFKKDNFSELEILNSRGLLSDVNLKSIKTKLGL